MRCKVGSEAPRVIVRGEKFALQAVPWVPSTHYLEGPHASSVPPPRCGSVRGALWADTV